MWINLPTGANYYLKHSKDDKPNQQDFQMHAHSHYEILVFLSGDISYLVEGNVYHPKPWDILIFNIAETHTVNVLSNKPYERMVIQMDKNIFGNILPQDILFAPFTQRELGKNNILHPKYFKDDLWKRTLTRLTTDNEPDRLEALAEILSLLAEIRFAFNNQDKNIIDSSLSSQIVRYVNERITQPLTAESIAKQFFISRTALYSIFRESTGTGIHNYINVKRLIMAQELLRQNQKPTDVFEKCGFQDYSTFFRAYKSHFFISPKEEYNRSVLK